MGTPVVLTADRPVAMTIAGTDSSGGAGVVADVKTFAAMGVWSAVAVTAVTAQNSLGVREVHPVPAGSVVAQIEQVTADLAVHAAKTGMLATAATVAAVARIAQSGQLGPLVVDPVLYASTGHRLLDEDGRLALAEELAPHAAVVTPNLREAEALTGIPVCDRDTMAQAGRALVGRGARAALVTGGHLVGATVVPDCLVLAGSRDAIWLEADRVDQPTTHGTGCVLSAAITAGLASGQDIETACRRAKRFVTAAIRAGTRLGAGPGAVEPALSERAW